MQITGHQAKQILGVSSSSTINNLIKAGVLHDLKEHKKGAKKIFPLFDSAEVNKVAKYYSLRIKPEKLLENMQNGIRPVARKSSQNGNHPVANLSNVNPIGKLTSIDDRLSRLEQKIDKLIQMWS